MNLKTNVQITNTDITACSTHAIYTYVRLITTFDMHKYIKKAIISFSSQYTQNKSTFIYATVYLHLHDTIRL